MPVVDIAYMRKYVAATAQLNVWLEDKLTPYRLEHAEAVKAAEFKCAEEMSKQIVWDSAVTRGSNTDYWKRVGPQLEGYLYKWRDMDAKREMEAEIARADAKFELDTLEIRGIYQARLEKITEGLGNDQ
jgi:hypothetical protein